MLLSIYKNSILLLGLSLLVSVLFFIISLILVNRNIIFGKTEVYETGSRIIRNARDPINTQFYLISLLFLIFDLELIFMYCWVINMHILPVFSFFYIFFFVVFLSMGFIYEWIKGGLDLFIK